MDETEKEVIAAAKSADCIEVEEEGNFETIEEDDLEEEENDTEQLESSVINENEESMFSTGHVVIEADKNTPNWSQIKDEVNKVLQDYMKNTNSKFVAYHKTVNYLTDNFEVKRHRVYFEDSKIKGRPKQILYDGTPYLVVGKNVLDCEFGVDRCVAAKKKLLDVKALEALNKFSDSEQTNGDGKVIKRRKHAISKKFACPCRIIIKDAVFFPAHKAEANTVHHKKKSSKKLYQDFKDGKDIPMKRKVFIKFPFVHEHQNHPLGGTQGRRRRRDNRKKPQPETNQESARSSINDHDYVDPSLPNDMIGGIPTSTYRIWSRYMLQLVKKLNNFHQTGSSKNLCRPFKVKGIECGIIPLAVITELQLHQDVFHFVKDETTENIKYITLVENLQTVDERTTAVDNVLQQLREKPVFSTLNGWRDELYSVTSSFGGEILLEMERAATCLFGIHTYGVHVNGFVKNEENKISMWIGRRSNTKQTWPGKLDNMVGGGLTSRSKIEDILVKECLEEAMVPVELARLAKPAGTVSYTFEDERGIFPETQFIFDLEIPDSFQFQPMNLDGEVQAFYLLTIEEVKALIATDEFKPNCALIVLDFLIRHGFIHPDEEPHYTEFLKGIHS